MQWFTNLRIRGKMLAASGVMLGLTTALGLFAIRRLADVSADTAVLAQQRLPASQAVSNLRAQVFELRIAQYRTITEPTAEGRQAGASTVRTELGHLATASTAYESLITTDAERDQFAAFRQALTAYVTDWQGIEALLARAPQETIAARMVTTSRPLHVTLDNTLTALIERNQVAATDAATAAQARYERARTQIILGLLLCVAAGFAVSTIVARRMTDSLASVMRAATSLQQHCIAGARRAIDRLALGDMSVRTEAVTQFIGNTDDDEIGEMARTCDRMIVDVKAVLASVTATQERVEGMVVDAIRLVDAARAGELDVRTDHTRYEGSFRTLVAGLNDTLDAVATPMAEVNDVLSKVAARDLTSRVTGSYHGTFASVASGVNSAIDNLDTTLTQVSTAATQVAHATAEITASAQTLASGSSEQAASLEEISASVHVFASMTEQSAASALEASRLATSARADVDEGAGRMERLTQAVNEIRESSGATARIIRTIDEIAFQTNLLALNAAVEAARAGDAGRGFAVVADEVRALALRAASAAHTTSELIEQGQGAAERGVALNAQVLQSFSRINEQIVRVSDVTAAISSAGRQQEEGVAQIMAAVDQINMVTQQVAASAEESASSATELSSQSESLRATVEQFTLTSTAPRSVRKVASRPRGAVRTPVPITRASARPVPAGAGAAPGSVFLF